MKKPAMKQFIHDLVPPLFVRLYQQGSGAAGYSGSYHDWADAKRASTGYDADLILEKVKNALLKVKSGEAPYERDSVLFDEVQYSWPLLAGLLWIASQNDNRLSLLDFGGSLGSSFYQNLKFLSHMKELQWGIVEQEKFVSCGRQNFENDYFKFYNTLDECIDKQKPGVIFLGSVLQYLEKPYDFLQEIIDREFSFILIDRTPFLTYGQKDRLTVQTVPPSIYTASYPAWFFNLDIFKDVMSKKYEFVAEFNTLDRANIPSTFKGFILKRLE
jgi:putative methyltransferase (TIGR04325 family)